MIKSDKVENMNELSDVFKNSYLMYNTENDIQDELDDKLVDTIRETYDMQNVEKTIIMSQLQYIFSKRLRIILKDRNIKGKDSQKLFGISEKTISQYINGKSFPNLKVLAKIANGLQTTPNNLLGLTNCNTFHTENINKILGISERAMYNLFKLHHDVEEVKELDENIPPSMKNKDFLRIFSLFISKYSYFCEFLTYQKQYVKTKQEINELNNKKEKCLNYKLEEEYLDDKLLRN